MVALGRANRRMKDFYDIWILTRAFAFEPDRIATTVAATFACRRTELPVNRPKALTAAFVDDPLKRHQWSALPSNSTA